MRKMRVVQAVAAAAALSALVGGSPAYGNPRSPNGQIAFEYYGQIPDESVVAVLNPDGSGLRTVSSLAPFGRPHWAPDGTRIATVPGGDTPVVATIFNVDTGSVTTLPNAYGINLGCTVWSPDGARLACSSSFTEGAPESAGIYTVRASDGLGISRVTSNPEWGDEPGSYSPNGKMLEFARFNEDGAVGLFVVKLDGSGLRRITPPGALIDGDRFGDWSPQGNNIIFAQHDNADVRNSIWVVHADGSGLREIHFDTSIPCGGARADPLSRGCFDPTWSPDGKKIAFIVNEPGGEGESVYIANADGTDVQQLTHGDSEYTDWGTHPAN
jgi:Tol biopolymer transport system component